jgi:hypothetical protein
MHFLSHYYTELPNNNPLFVVALGIPDLTHGFAKAYNSRLKHAATPLPDDMALIHHGILQHFAADARFHSSPAFMQQVKEATASLMQAGMNRQHLRLSVIAHLAVEMLIDRQIIIQQPHVCNEYYQLIGKADESILHSYFIQFGLKGEKKVFSERFAFFRERKFLYLFDDLENLVFGLNRIYSSVTKVEFTLKEKAQLKEGLHNIDNIIRYRWQEILSV